MDFKGLNQTLNDITGKAQRSQKLSAKPFLISLAVYGCLLLVTAFLFTLLKDRSVKTFQPRCEEDGDLEKLRTGSIAWIMQLHRMSADENRFIDKYGEDCFFFVRFLMVALKLLLPLSLVAIPVLVPVYYTASSPPRVSGLDQFGISSIQTSQNIRCWIITLIVIISNVHTCRILFNEIKNTVRVRQNHLHHLVQVNAAATVLVTGIPPEKQNEKALAADLFAYNGGPSTISLPEITSFRTKQTDLVNMEALGSKSKSLQNHASPTLFQAVREIISRAKNKYSPSRRACGLHGEANRSRNNALLRFDSIFTAHLMLQSPVSTNPFTMKAYLLDDDKTLDRFHDGQDVCPKPFKDFIIRVLLDGLSVLWAIPISLTGLLSQIVYLEPISSQLTKLSEGQMAAIQGLLPQIALALLMCGFPIIMQWIIKRTTIFQLSLRELSIQKHYFFFLYVQVFLVVSLSSSVTTMIPDIIENVQSVSTILADNLPKASNYFYSYLLLQALTQCAMVFFQLPDSLLFYVRCHSGRARSRTIQWSLLYPVLTSLLCICIIFTIISPLILAIGAVAFSAFRIAYSYQAIYIVRTSVETAGLLYWQALHHVFVAIYTMDVFVIGLFVLRGAAGPTIVTLVLLILVGLLQRYILVTYRNLLMYVSAVNVKSRQM